MDYNTASRLFEKLSKIDNKLTELSGKIEKNFQKMMEGFKCIQKAFRLSVEKQMEFNETLKMWRSTQVPLMLIILDLLFL